MDFMSYAYITVDRSFDTADMLRTFTSCKTRLAPHTWSRPASDHVRHDLKKNPAKYHAKAGYPRERGRREVDDQIS